MNKKIILGMSGGVDSATAALILKKQGFEVIGVTLQLKNNMITNDIRDAQKVAETLNIKHYIYDFTNIFHKKVIDYFVSTYLDGRTPNPCIACNRYIKFQGMLNIADKLNIPYIATGHYAKTEYNSKIGRWLLKRSKSPKDQSYLLYNLSQEQLSRTIFPLQDYSKEEIRILAEKEGLSVANKTDSQDICFIENNNYAKFIENYTGKIFPDGYFIDLEGNPIGTHHGIIHYTIGQRKKLGISFGQHMYVCKINAKNNTITLGPEGSQTASTLYVNDLNWIAIPSLQNPMEVFAKPRYRAIPAKAVIFPEKNKIMVKFESPQRSLTPGQAIVFYKEDIVIGGGTIEDIIR